MIDELKKNVDSEISILREISKYINHYEKANNNDKKIIVQTINSLVNNLKIINQSLPELLNNVTIQEKPEQKKNVSQIQIQQNISSGKEEIVTLPRQQRDELFKSLNISKKLIRRLGRTEKKIEKSEDFAKSRGYLKTANKFFLDKSKEMINGGKFKDLSGEIKRANIPVIPETYVSMMFFSSVIAFFAGIILSILLLFFNFNIIMPYMSVYQGDFFPRLGQVFWIPFVLPVLTFAVLYFYPSMEKKSIAKKIDHEIPFAVIHMGAISGSGIEPSQIFKIIGMSGDYPALNKEIRKILNQINLYGYDLVTALGNVARNTPSEKFSELLSGLAVTIHSGGGLKEFFDKRGESLMAAYRMEREKDSKMAETFMDIYISVVIAAPMILMLILIIVSVTGIGIQLSQNQIALLIVSMLSLINVLFLIFLHLKQPGD